MIFLKMAVIAAVLSSLLILVVMVSSPVSIDDAGQIGAGDSIKITEGNYRLTLFSCGPLVVIHGDDILNPVASNAGQGSDCDQNEYEFDSELSGKSIVFATQPTEYIITGIYHGEEKFDDSLGMFLTFSCISVLAGLIIMLLLQYG